QPLSMLGVFGLELSISEDDLHIAFSRFGVGQTVMLVVDWKMQCSWGYAFITMESVQDATQCISSLNNTVCYRLCPTSLDYSITDRPYTRTPGAYLG
ncbi:hypothetical protein K439DRAFT_1321855, partial [Ramaria rubella]